MKIIEKLGGVSNIFNILQEANWPGKITALRMQIARGSLSKEVCLLLIQYMDSNNIDYEMNDFYNVNKESEHD